MYVNMIDDLFDGVLNKFYDFLTKENVISKISSDTNFVKYQIEILSYIKKFIDTINKKDILEIIKKESYIESIMNIIKRYCAFYIYLSIAYNYSGGRDLFIINMIEASKYQKDATIQIPNFFNSENNAKIIIFYNDIKNFISLLQFKTIDKIKIVLSNNPLKYESTIKLFNDLGEDYVVEFFLVKDNFHNIMKALIFKQIYLKEEKSEIINILNQQEQENAEYKYIEIVVSNNKKIVDFDVIQRFLSLDELRSGLAEEIYSYLEENRDTKEIVIKEEQEFINYLFANKILIPITEDFLRYHKDTEKYDPESLIAENIKERDATKIKYIVNKMNNVKNFYSSLVEKNPKLKLEAEKLFFKPLDPKLAVLFNDNEEVKIIQKLRASQLASDIDLLVDLENIRKYAYVNFKNFSRDGIKFRPDETIQAIRYTSLKQKKSANIEVRIGHNNIDFNVVGVAWNPSAISLDCIKTGDTEDVRLVTSEGNGLKALLKIMKTTFQLENKTKPKKLYYWLFDNSKDKPELDSYVDYNIDDPTKNIKIMLHQLYNNYISMVYNKINNYMNKTTESVTLWSFNKLFKNYYKKYFNFDLNTGMRNEIIEKVIIDMIPELEIVEDEIESLMPGKREAIILLPKLKIKDDKFNIIELNEKIIDITLELSNKNLAICNHYIRWNNIMAMSKKSDQFNQAIFEFVKQYVRPNERTEYTCKSCNEVIQIQKYVGEGFYNEEQETFSTTSIIVNQKLEENPKYSKYMRTLRNIEKNIEKFAFAIDLHSFIGNTPVIKLRRKMAIKDVIDLVLIHTEWLRKQPKDRGEQFNKKYGIDKHYTNLFFFELKDDIFLTSSTDTDQYKIIKYNNIIAYMIVILISELNSGQIVSLKDDKKYNYFFYEKVGHNLFNDLLLRVNQKERIPLTKLPLFSYMLYYLSGMMITYRLWLWNDSKIDAKDKPANIINIQKTIINTVLDLINSIVEANFEENKNYMYEIINARISTKITQVYNDKQLLKRIEEEAMKYITFNVETNKVTFTSTKIGAMNLNIEYKMAENRREICDLQVTEITKLPILKDNNNIDILTVCADGKFHVWTFKTNDLICSLCNKSYNEMVKLIDRTETTENSNTYLDKIKHINLLKLSRKYCISGESHDIGSDGICSKCKKEPATFVPSDKELKQFDKNLDAKAYEVSLIQINKLRKYNTDLENEKIKARKIINKLLKRYETLTEGKLEDYILDFVNRLVKILGNKIKVADKTIYLKETVYLLDHDYMGSDSKETISILSSEDKVQLANNHPLFNKDVIFYKDKANKVTVFYDSISLQYLGYSDDNKTLKKNRNNASLKIELSIKDCIMYMGQENQYLNIYHLSRDYMDNLPTSLGEDTKEIVLKIVRNRMNNLKQIISRTQSIIFNVRNSGNVTSIYNFEEKEIIMEFTKKLKKFNISDAEKHNVIFKHNEYVLTKLPINYNIPENLNIELNKNYIDTSKIASLDNSDNKLIFYLIYNFNKLLDYNDAQPVILSELAHLLIKIIRYQFNSYYRPYSNYNIRKFDFLLLNETPYIDETLKTVGHYQELLTKEEIDDPEKKEQEYTNKEESDALDIDDYELDDDIDEAAEANDGDNNE
jgi:hypothetical protein